MDFSNRIMLNVGVHQEADVGRTLRSGSQQAMCI